MSGQRFGSWTVLSYVGNHYWNCRCDCGRESHVDGRTLRRGESSRCMGCRKDFPTATTHGESKTRLWDVWQGMKARCGNPNHESYKNYGGRGIAVCAEWTSDFATFRKWAVQNGYKSGLTLERRDNNGGYDPDNCRWAPRSEQMRNMRRNRWVEYQGRMILFCDLCLEVGLSPHVLHNRLFSYGWPIEEAVSVPVLPKGMRRSHYPRGFAENIRLSK